MSPVGLRTPKDVRTLAARRYTARRKEWLLGAGEWPWRVLLGSLTEAELGQDMGAVRQWARLWDKPDLTCTVEYIERSWPRLGQHTLPSYAVFKNPLDIAETIGEARRWNKAVMRASDLQQRHAMLHGHAALARHFDALADSPEEDYQRLLSLLQWSRTARAEALYLRQLPIEGLDTKWIGARRALARDFLLALGGQQAAPDATLESLLGLRRVPTRVRVRVLCPGLRAQLAGLGDIEAPVSEVAALPIAPECALIVENLETGLALPDIPSCVCFMKLGLAVGLLAEIGWLRTTPRVFYWGDVDTHGFVILDQARKVVPQIESILMDEHTIETHSHLLTEEPTQASAARLQNLTDGERHVLRGLYEGRWRQKPRLEQERLCWAEALNTLYANL